MAYEFEEQTIKIIIDQSRCPECESKACVKGCELYDRSILIIKDGVPMLREGVDPKREGSECLSCEEECRLRSFKAIRIKAPIPGLKEWVEKVRKM